MLRYLLLPLLLLSAARVAAAVGERGAPMLDLYSADEMGSSFMHENVYELRDGRIVVANTGGPVVFDGVRWTAHYHPEKRSGMRSAAEGPDGRLHTGFNGDVGWFADDGTGRWIWHSLGADLKAAGIRPGRPFSVFYDATRRGVWHVHSDGVIFLPDDGSALRHLAAPRLFGDGFLVGDELWIEALSDGLLRLSNADPLALEPVPDRERLQGKFLRAAVAGPRAGEILVMLTDGRLLTHRNGTFAPWAEALWPQLGTTHVTTLLRRPVGGYAIGSMNSGPWLLDDAGQLVDRYGAGDGVPARPTQGLYEDRWGGLWLAQYRTVVRLDLARGVTRFDASHGLSAGFALARHRDGLFVADGTGLFRLDHQAGGGAHFERLMPEMRNVRQLAVQSDGELLVGNAGVIRVWRDAQGEWKRKSLSEEPIVHAIEASRLIAGRVYYAHLDGVRQMQRGDDGGYTVSDIPMIDWAVYMVVEQSADLLWLADRAGGLWRASVSGQFPPRRIGAEQGLPAGPVRVYRSPRRGAWFATREGLRVYDEASDRLIAPSDLPIEARSGEVFLVAEDEEGHLWLRVNGGNAVAWREQGGYRLDRQTLEPLNPTETVYGYLREGSIVWIAQAGGLARLDLDAQRPPPSPAAPRLTDALDQTSGRRLHFGELASLPADLRSLRIRFTLPVPYRPTLSRYRSRLVGIEPNWSEWSGTAEREYVNLPDGHTRFELESRDAFGRVSVLPPLAIHVAAPWWRTTPARAGYVALSVAAFWLAARFGSRRRHRRMLARQRELESEVDHRTRELQHKNELLAAQALHLAEVDRLKTRFFINVGHEFRTPLTLVLGPLDDLLRDTRERLGHRARDQIELAYRNARRVLGLIVELLDVNRFEQRHMRMTRTRTDLRRLAQRVLMEQVPVLDRYGHRAELVAADDADWDADVDAPQVERCLGNLIVNAAKYMARGGVVRLRLVARAEEVEMAVEDQGRGIPPGLQAHVFDRFFRAGGADGSDGYGIGLALVREIAEAHGGRVSLESEPGQGSIFRVALPRVAASTCAQHLQVEDAAGAEDSDAAPPAPGPGPAPTPGAEPRARARVLVVDDHDDLRARVRLLLEQRFDVIEAADGPAAWRLARDELPDLIVCDVMMPGFDGNDLARRLRADPDTSAIALLLLTAKAGSEHAAEGLRAGADDYLIKPFDADELIARIDALLARGQRLRLRLSREASPPSATPSAESSDQRWLRRLDEAASRGLDDPQFGTEALAAAMHTDRSHLLRRCKELLGMPPSDYLRDLRLKRARDLLEQRAGNVSEIAYACGFDSLSSFTRAFKARYGQPPSRIVPRRSA